MIKFENKTKVYPYDGSTTPARTVTVVRRTPKFVVLKDGAYLCTCCV